MRPGRVLAPALICDTAVDGLPRHDREVHFYPVTKDLRPDWAWLERHADASDAALLLVHYFGFANDAERAARFAQDRGLALIEDCAHSFLSGTDGQALGWFGDFAILSFRKSLPLRSGGALLSRAPISDAVPRARLPGIAPGFVIRELLKWTLFRTGSSWLARHFGSAVSDEHPVSLDDCGRMDALSRRLLSNSVARLHGIRETRRHNYAALVRGLVGTDAIRLPFPALDEGTCPWAMPLVTAHADDLLHVLLSEGIGAWKWPDLPSTLPSGQFQHERELARGTVLLPVHQNLGAAHVRYMIDTVTAWSLGVG